jgi:hypothetical protein
MQLLFVFLDRIHQAYHCISIAQVRKETCTSSGTGIIEEETTEVACEAHIQGPENTWYSLIPVMREEDPDEFFKFWRMTPECFDFVLEKVSPVLRKTSYREPISPGERLAVTLRYYQLISSIVFG